jgi:hypothetical protein
MVDQPQQDSVATPPFEQLKTKLILHFGQLYKDFATRIATLPGNQKLIQRAMERFDDGFLNFREAIASLQANEVQMVMSGQPQDEPQQPQEQMPDLPPAA